MQYRIEEGIAYLCAHELDGRKIVDILNDDSEDVFLRDNNVYSPITHERPTSKMRFIYANRHELLELLNKGCDIHHIDDTGISAVRKDNKIFIISKRSIEEVTALDYLGRVKISNEKIREIEADLDNTLREAIRLRSKLNLAHVPIRTYEIENEGWKMTYNEKGEGLILSPTKEIFHMDSDLKYIIFMGLAKSKKNLIKRGFIKFIKERKNEDG